MKITDKTAVVTGATGGIGLAVSENLAMNGAKGVAIVDLSEKCQAVADRINEQNHREVAMPFQGDVTDGKFRETVFAEIADHFGPVQICVPAAGILKDGMAVKLNRENGRTEIYSEEKFRQTLEVNLMHPAYWAMQMIAGIAEYRSAKGLGPWQPDEPVQGSVVLIGSVSSRGNRGQVSYSAAKAGLNAVTSTLNAEGLYYGVLTKIIHPGFVDTPMVASMPDNYFEENLKHLIGLGRMIRPEEIADAVASLIENPIISGQLWADASLRALI